jgi:uncharacterized RDD family membrane protein YckC
VLWYAIVVPAFLVSAVLSEVVGENAFVLIVLTFPFVLAATIRSFIQRGRLGYDSADRFVGVTVLRQATGAPMGSGWSAFARVLVHVIDGLPLYLGYFWPIWDRKRQTFTDKSMGTIVVADRPQPHSARTLWVNALQFWRPVIAS